MEAISSYKDQTRYERPVLYDYLYSRRFRSAIMLAITLPRLDRSVHNLSVNKFILALLYWVSSTIIFVLFGISKFFFNNPLVLLVFVLVFFSSVYLSVIRLADMRKKDWLILSGIFGAIVLFFFLPEL